MAEKATPTKTQVVAHLKRLLDSANESGLQLGDKAAIARTIRILKGK